MARNIHGSAHADNAMTEIALALAMGFFSIMVLTMVSMGAGQVAATVGIGKEQQIAIVESEHASPSSTAQQTEKQNLIVYFEGRYINADLHPVDPAAFNPPGRAVLALHPDLSVSEAMSARAPIAFPDLIVTTLTDDWLQRLKVSEQ